MKEGNFDSEQNRPGEDVGFSVEGGEQQSFVDRKITGAKPVEGVGEDIAHPQGKAEALKDLAGSLEKAKQNAIDELDPEERQEYEEKVKTFEELIDSLQGMGIKVDGISTGGEKSYVIDYGNYFDFYIPVPEGVQKLKYPTITNPSIKLRIEKR